MMASTNSYICLGNVIVAKPSWSSLLFVTRAVDKRHSVTKEYLTVQSQCVWRSFFQSNVERMFL